MASSAAIATTTVAAIPAKTRKEAALSHCEAGHADFSRNNHDLALNARQSSFSRGAAHQMHGGRPHGVIAARRQSRHYDGLTQASLPAKRTCLSSTRATRGPGPRARARA